MIPHIVYRGRNAVTNIFVSKWKTTPMAQRLAACGYGQETVDLWPIEVLVDGGIWPFGKVGKAFD